MTTQFLGKLKDGSELVLENGTSHPLLVASVLNTKPSEVRPEDLEEFRDYLGNIGYTDREMFGPDFGQLLALGLRLMGPNTRTYTIGCSTGLPFMRRVFVGTLSRVGEGVALMSGFGLTVGYSILSKRDIYTSVGLLMGMLVWDMVHVFDTRHAVCHVKNTNASTLLMWRFLKRQGIVVDGRSVDVNIIDDPFMRGYKLVTLSLKEV